MLAGTDARAIGIGLAEALTGVRRLPDADACRSLVRTRFDWPVIAARTAAVYRDALQ
ncbi:hypothetical protein [Azospirillum sp. INR13]|uniref:hypothetical protein n=1 Tax=Azospirillum sp. INR13 TaxID=2596919 RepID=UPI0021076FAE|nr:hypothetical protein [Azospirillum sp. INR13]